MILSNRTNPKEAEGVGDEVETEDVVNNKGEAVELPVFTVEESTEDEVVDLTIKGPVRFPMMYGSMICMMGAQGLSDVED